MALGFSLHKAKMFRGMARDLLSSASFGYGAVLAIDDCSELKEISNDELKNIVKALSLLLYGEDRTATSKLKEHEQKWAERKALLTKVTP
jgi:hypothetical protein